MAAPSSWKAWRSVSVAWARMGTEVPAKLEELLAGIGAAIDAVGGSFTMRYTTVAVTAARTGAASPAFTLSAPGGDAETVRRHGDFVSAEPEDTCPPVRSSHCPGSRQHAQLPPLPRRVHITHTSRTHTITS
jgi:hypothetical protein